MSASRSDPIVPFAHARRLHAALARSRLVALRPEAAPFVHDAVAPEDLLRLRAAERRLLDRVAR